MRLISLFLIALLVVLSFSLYAQEGELVNRAVGESPLSFGTGAALVAALAGAVPSEQPVDPEDAVAVLGSLGYRLPDRSIDDPITYGNFALLMMQAFDVRGGLRYEIFPTSAAAFEELRSRSLLSPDVYAGTPIPGVVAVDVASHFLSDLP
ncbi:MAG: hypothetical protein ACLFPV_12005 [Spirochaetaceae bacterium]